MVSIRQDRLVSRITKFGLTPGLSDNDRPRRDPFQKLNSVQDGRPLAADDEGSDAAAKRASQNVVRRVRREAQSPFEELLMKAYVGWALLVTVLVAASAPDEAATKETQGEERG